MKSLRHISGLLACLLFAANVAEAQTPAVFLVKGVESINEGGPGTTPLVLGVRLTAPSPSQVSVQYATRNGTASAPWDYVSASGTVIFPPYSTYQPINLQIVGDLQVEPDENFFVDLSNSVGATIGSFATTNVQIRNDDQTPNQHPTANIPPLAGNRYPGQTVTLNAIASDPDGDQLQYFWSLEMKPAGSNAMLTFLPDPTTITFTPDRTGDYTVKVTVNDGKGGVAQASIIVHVVLPSPPAFSFAPPASDVRHICFPPYMIWDPATTHYWWAKAAGNGPLVINFFAFCVNTDETGNATIKVTAPDGTLFGPFTVPHPTTSAGAENRLNPSITINAPAAGALYRIEVNVAMPPPGKAPARHYRMEFDGALLIGTNSPLQPQPEHNPARWGFNVRSNEAVDIVVLGDPSVGSGAKAATVQVWDPNGVLRTTTGINNPIHLQSSSPGMWTIGVWPDTDPDKTGHYLIDKTTGVDRGLYIGAFSDLEPPDLFAPGPKFFATTANATECGMIISDEQLGQATAKDDCRVRIHVHGVPPGNNFPVGETVITYTAVDGAGNSKSAQQTVTVKDETPPLITCPEDITVIEEFGKGSALVKFADLKATDNCGIKGVESVPPSGSRFPVGTTRVISTATDIHGNQSTCSFTVTVKKIECFTMVSVDANFIGKAWKGAKQVPVKDVRVIMLPKAAVQTNVQNLLDAPSVWAKLDVINAVSDPVVKTDVTGKVIAYSTVPDPNGWAIYIDLKNGSGVGVTAPVITAGTTQIAVANSDCAPQKKFTVKLETDGTTTTAGTDRQSNISSSAEAEEKEEIEGVVIAVPTEYAIHNAYPNPFNPATTIQYDLPEETHVRITVFDLLGREVALLVDGQRNAGRYSVTFEAKGLQSGMYLYRMETSRFRQTRRFILLK